jgi:ribosomal protein S18 acetylase RimI-like enzyme
MAERDFGWADVRPSRKDYVIDELTSADRIRELLKPRVEYTAYALGQLEPGLFERTRWHYARGSTGTGLVLHSRGGLGDATFVMGDPDAVSATLSIYPGAVNTYVTCQPQHVDGLRQVYRLSNQQPMIRMSVRPADFQPAQRIRTIALQGIDIRRVNQLYSAEGNPSYYIPEHLDQGVYRGVVVDGRLVAVAGTHVVSAQERVAVVGNVFTHPAYRGYGYATAATSAVTEALLRFCDTVVLTVDPKNSPAVSAYRRLGYQQVCQLVEASAVRRDPSGLAAALRRWRARFRGRRYSGAFVSIR